MKEYEVSVLIKVKVDAFSEADALDAVHDCYGEGEACGLNVLEYEVVTHVSK
jgi:hypothetical protein